MIINKRKFSKKTILKIQIKKRPLIMSASNSYVIVIKVNTVYLFIFPFIIFYLKTKWVILVVFNLFKKIKFQKN